MLFLKEEKEKEEAIPEYNNQKTYPGTCSIGKQIYDCTWSAARFIQVDTETFYFIFRHWEQIGLRVFVPLPLCVGSFGHQLVFNLC